MGSTSAELKDGSKAFKQQLKEAAYLASDHTYREEGEAAEEEAKRYKYMAAGIARKIVACEKPWVIALGGGPGSGKGTVLSWLQANDIVPKKPVVGKVDCDAIRTKLPAWVAAVGDASQRPDRKAEIMEKGRADTQVLAGKIAERAAKLCLDQGKNFVFDSTLRNLEWTKFMLAEWRRSHRVCVIFIDTELDITQRRVQQRYEATGRPVQPEFVLSCHKDSRSVAAEIEKEAQNKNMVDLFVRIKNDKDVVLDSKDKENIQQFMGVRASLSLMQRSQVFFSHGGTDGIGTFT